MSRQIGLSLNLKEAYIIKHALRDKSGRDEAETKVFEMVTDAIDEYKDHKRIWNVNTLRWAEKQIGLVIEKAPYQEEILKAFDDGVTKRVIIKGAAQIGMSAIFDSVATQRAIVKKAPVLIVKANKDIAQIYLRKRLVPLFGNFPDDKKENGRWVGVCGADSIVEMRGRRNELIILDDVDKNHVYKEENETCLQHLIGALQKQPSGIIAIGSVPSVKNASKIDDEYGNGTQEEWRHRCPVCWGYQLVKIEDLIVCRWLKTGEIKKVDWSCPNCGAVVKEDEMRSLDQKYIAQNEFPASGTRSFFINAFALLSVTWKQIVEEWEKAQGDPIKMRVVTNTRFGESY